MTDARRSVQVVARCEVDGASPRELRERFAEALRAGIVGELVANRIDLAEAEELRRILPESGRE